MAAHFFFSDFFFSSEMDTAIDDSSLVSPAAPFCSIKEIRDPLQCFYSRQQRRFKAQRDMNQVCGGAEAQFMDTQAHKWPLRPHVHTAIPFSAICLGDVTKKSLAGPTVEHMFGDNQLPSVNRWNQPPPSHSLALIFTFSLFLWRCSAAIYCPWRVGQVSQTAA